MPPLGRPYQESWNEEDNSQIQDDFEYNGISTPRSRSRSTDEDIYTPSIKSRSSLEFGEESSTQVEQLDADVDVEAASEAFETHNLTQRILSMFIEEKDFPSATPISKKGKKGRPKLQKSSDDLYQDTDGEIQTTSTTTMDYNPAAIAAFEENLLQELRNLEIIGKDEQVNNY